METPRVDALLLGLYGTERVEAEKQVNEFARQLERELIQARSIALRDKSVRNDAETVANSVLRDMKDMESWLEELEDMLQDAADTLYNPLDPNNQSQGYKELCLALAKVIAKREPEKARP